MFRVFFVIRNLDELERIKNLVFLEIKSDIINVVRNVLNVLEKLSRLFFNCELWINLIVL